MDGVPISRSGLRGKLGYVPSSDTVQAEKNKEMEELIAQIRKVASMREEEKNFAGGARYINQGGGVR